MFTTFSGNTRRPRQVNLSGRKTHAFGNPGTGAGSQAALDRAQQERAQRQRERDELRAAKVLQRVWRGHSARQQVANMLRSEWDAMEGSSIAPQSAVPYSSEAEAFSQLQRLLRFAHARNEEDLSRIRHSGFRQMGTVQSLGFPSSGLWPLAYLRLQKLVLTAIERRIRPTAPPWDQLDAFLTVLHFLADRIPTETSQNAKQFYHTLALVISRLWSGSDHVHDKAGGSDVLKSVLETVLSPLTKVTGYTLNAYEAFGYIILTLPILSSDAKSSSAQTFRDSLAESINYKLLASALATLFKTSGIHSHPVLEDIANRLRLLGIFIYFHRYAHNFNTPEAYSVHKDFVTVVSLLLNSLPISIIDDQNDSDQSDDHNSAQYSETVNEFVKEQVLSLVNQEGIGNLLSSSSQSSKTSEDEKVEEARQLANYSLALLRFFPRRGDEIRMWLYMGPSGARSSQDSSKNSPAIRYFWEASKRSSVFGTILRDSRAAIELLRTKPFSASISSESTSSATLIQQGLWQASKQEAGRNAAIADEWRVILVFLELYTFVLKVTDDEEFFVGGQDGFLGQARGNALPLSEVKDLTTFLKNLGFTLYFNSADITASEEREAPAKLGFFSSRLADSLAQKPAAEPSVGGVRGLTPEYIKGLVTGLLRMLYERDSRRKFLPSDHWLMTTRFDMTNFIPAVVEEEESRHKVEEEDAEDMEEEDEVDDTPQLIGTGRIQQQRRIERMQREQRKLSRRRYLQNVAPRLEILQNMPFMIPFTTRVQIFREFVALDMVS